MKKLIKVLALAIAMIITISLAQPVGTEAAAKPKLNTTKKTVFVGGSSVYPKYKNGYITLKVNKRPKQYSVEWTSSDSDVIKIEPLGKYRCTVTALMPGKATVTAEVIDKTKTPNTKYTLTCKITVKANCAAVDITPSTLPEMEIGQTASLTGTMYGKSGKTLIKGVTVTDVIRWTTSDAAVATVDSNGLVKAIGEGTATITCYTIQATSGTYSKITKATAKDSVTVKVKHVETAIEAVEQKSLKTVNVKFGKDYSAILKAENFKITKGTSNIEVSKVEFAKDGFSAILTTKSELDASAEYTVSVSGTTAVEGLSKTFKTSAGVPASMELYSDIAGNRVIAAQISTLYFRLFDANGVDITPTDRTSNAYKNYANYITCKATDSTSIVCYVNGNTVMIYDEGKSINVTGYYNNYRGTSFSANVTVTSVSEAATMSLVETIVTKSAKAAAELDWANPNHKMSSSDYTAGYKLVAKVMKSDGSFIYSDAVGTKITFALPDNYTPNAVFCDNSGALRPFQTGADTLVVKYDGVIIGTATVVVGEARIPATLKVLVDGTETNNLTLSDATATNPSVAVAVYDNYGELWSDATAGELTLTCNTVSSPVVYASGMKSEGIINISMFAYGTGSLSGSAYTYLVTYEHGTVKTATSFTMMVFKPNESLPTTYKISVSGDTNMVVDSRFDTTNGKSVKLTLVAYKGNVRYQDMILATKTSAAVNDYYVVLRNSSGTEMTLESSGTDLIFPIAKVTGNNITKAVPGTYTYVLYQKGSTGTDAPKATGSFTITDTQEGATYEQTSQTTLYPLTTSVNQSIVDSILSQNFKFSVNGTVAYATVTNYMAGSGYLYIRTVAVNATISVGGSNYIVQIPLEVNKVVRSTSN